MCLVFLVAIPNLILQFRWEEEPDWILSLFLNYEDVKKMVAKRREER